MDFFYQKFGFFGGDYGVDHAGFFVCVASGAFEAGCCVIGEFEDFFVNLVRFFGDDKQGVFFVSLVEHLDHLCGGELEDDGVKCSVPAEQNTCYGQDYSVSTENVVPDIASAFFGKINGDKVSSTGAGVTDQAQADAETVDQSAEDADQQGIVGNRLAWDNIREDAGEYDYTAGTDGEFFSDKFQADEYGNGVQQYVNECVWNRDSHKGLEDVLDQQGESGKSAWEKTACAYKGFDIQCHNRCSQNRTAVTFGFVL